MYLLQNKELWASILTNYFLTLGLKLFSCHFWQITIAICGKSAIFGTSKNL